MVIADLPIHHPGLQASVESCPCSWKRLHSQSFLWFTTAIAARLGLGDLFAGKGCQWYQWHSWAVYWHCQFPSVPARSRNCYPKDSNEATKLIFCLLQLRWFQVAAAEIGRGWGSSHAVVVVWPCSVVKVWRTRRFAESRDPRLVDACSRLQQFAFEAVGSTGCWTACHDSTSCTSQSQCCCLPRCFRLGAERCYSGMRWLACHKYETGFSWLSWQMEEPCRGFLD